MSAGIFSTPRPLPSRMGPTIAGGTVIALALPIFAIAGWPLQAWALGAVPLDRLRDLRGRTDASAGQPR